MTNDFGKSSRDFFSSLPFPLSSFFPPSRSSSISSSFFFIFFSSSTFSLFFFLCCYFFFFIFNFALFLLVLLPPYFSFLFSFLSFDLFSFGVLVRNFRQGTINHLLAMVDSVMGVGIQVRNIGSVDSVMTWGNSPSEISKKSGAKNINYSHDGLGIPIGGMSLQPVCVKISHLAIMIFLHFLLERRKNFISSAGTLEKFLIISSFFFFFFPFFSFFLFFFFSFLKSWRVETREKKKRNTIRTL